MRKRIEIQKGSAGKILGRLFRYMSHYYKWELLVVIICIAITAVVGIKSSLFLQKLGDDGITPSTAYGQE